MLKQRSLQQVGSTSAITHGAADGNRDEREKTTEGELKSVK